MLVSQAIRLDRIDFVLRCALLIGRLGWSPYHLQPGRLPDCDAIPAPLCNLFKLQRPDSRPERANRDHDHCHCECNESEHRRNAATLQKEGDHKTHEDSTYAAEGVNEADCPRPYLGREEFALISMERKGHDIIGQRYGYAEYNERWD